MKKTNAFAAFIDKKYIPLNKRVKIIIAVILFLLPAILFYFFWFKPQNVNATQLKLGKATLVKELKDAKRITDNKDKFEEELKATQSKFKETAELLPQEKEIPSLLTNISAHGRGAGLDFLAFKPGTETQTKDFFVELPIDIKVRGPYHNMGVFLDQVSKLDRIVTVSNITMAAPKKEGTEIVLDSSCRLVTYRFTNKAIAKPQDGKR